MDYQPDHATRLLRATPPMLDAWLRELPDSWLRANCGKDTFSPFDVVGHLICGEVDDWLPRLRLLLEHGEARPFTPFDRFAMYERDKDRSIAELLDEFARLRTENLAQLSQVAVEDQLDRTGAHPEFGVVTARQLLATWVAHDQTHVAQIARTLAHQYRDAVGPWRQYLGVLRD